MLPPSQTNCTVADAGTEGPFVTSNLAWSELVTKGGRGEERGGGRERREGGGNGRGKGVEREGAECGLLLK